MSQKYLNNYNTVRLARGNKQETEKISQQQKIVLLVVLVCYTMIILDASIVITGIPKIKESLGLSTAEVSWITNLYALCFGGFLLLGARMGDIYGRVRIFLGGIVLFTLASFVIGIAQSASILYFARAVQGIAAAVLAPTTLALLSIHFSDGEERQKALSYYAATAGVATSLGLVMGGLLADWMSWRVGFFINIPVGIFLFLMTRGYLKEESTGEGALDFMGAIMSTAGVGLFVFGLVQSTELGWRNPLIVLALVLGLFLISAFFVLQFYSKAPLLPLRILADRERFFSYIARMCFLGGMVGFFFFSTQFMQDGLGYSPLKTGFAYLPMTIMTFFSSMFVPKLTRRFGNASVLAVSFTFSSMGMFLMSHITPISTYFTVLGFPMFLIGIANGTGLGPLTIAGVRRVDKKDYGAASGVVNVAHQLGGTIGLGILVAVYSMSKPTGVVMSVQMLLVYKISHAFLGSMVLFVMGLLITVFIIRPVEKIHSGV